MQNRLILMQQLILAVIMYVITAVFTVILLEIPLIYVQGIQFVRPSIGMIWPSIGTIFFITLLISILVILLVCVVLLEQHKQSEPVILDIEALDNANNSKTNEEKIQALRRMRLISINGLLLKFAPLCCLLFLMYNKEIAYNYIIPIKTSFLELNLGLILLLWGFIAGSLYTDSANMIFQPLRNKLQLSLLPHVYYTTGVEPFLKIFLASFISCALIFLLTLVFFDLDRKMNLELINSISINSFDTESLSNITTEEQKNNISQQIQEYLYILLLFISLISLSWLNIYLICYKEKISIQNIFSHFRHLLENPSHYIQTLSVSDLDGTGAFIGYLNLFTINIYNVEKNIQQGGHHLQNSLDTQNNFVIRLGKLVEELEENIEHVDNFVKKEQNYHKLMDKGLNDMRNISFKTNDFFAHRQKDIYSIINQIHTLSIFLENIKQVSKKIESVSDILAISAVQGEEMVESFILCIQELAETTEILENTITVITRIAAQTSFLSINAAIEAVHAKEHGNGFAVLAHEVRVLAERISAHSQHICKKIKNLIFCVQSGLEVSQRIHRILNDISSFIDQSNISSISSIHQFIGNYQKNQTTDRTEFGCSLKIRRLVDIQGINIQDIFNSMKTFLQLRNTIMALQSEAAGSTENILHDIQTRSELMVMNKEILKKFLTMIEL